MGFKPLHDRVLLRRVGEEEKSAGGIIIPDTAQEKPSEGIVVPLVRAYALTTVAFVSWTSRPATGYCLENLAGPMSR